jgi:two-component system OmpR family response regulator
VHRVLLVDDEEHLLAMLEAALQFEGFDVSSATTGLDALAAVSRSAYDLIILDVMLPDLDGFEVCTRLRAEGVETPVFFLSARDSTEDLMRGLAIGDGYLTKPFSLKVLIARLRSVLGRRDEM